MDHPPSARRAIANAALLAIAASTIISPLSAAAAPAGGGSADERTASMEVSLPSVLPMPVTYEGRPGDAFVLSPQADIVATGQARDEAEKLAKTLRASTGYKLDVVDESTDDTADIELSLGDEGAQEAYVIDVSSDELAISASTTHGLFNGCQTTYQLFGPWSTSPHATNGPWSVPALHIQDEPRFSYRGIMLDPARSFFTKDEVKQAIDVLSKYKYSHLHLHLADDQGWRVEITNEGREQGDTIDYTALTRVGSTTAMGTTNQQAKPGITGFYTQEDLREITAYAHEHHIKIVPEIDMPGHSQSILHCIPELNTPGSSHDGTMKDGQKIENPKDYIVAPHQSTGDVGNSYLDPTSETTFTFLKHVVAQVADITDAEYFHFGGDETHALDNKHPGKAREFLARAATMVRDMGLKPIGWNEWSISDMKSGDAIQFWNGNMKPCTEKIQQQGAKGLYSSAAHCYFPQKAGEDIWGATWATGIADINDFYNYDPAAEMGARDDQMLGVEGAMWNEHARGIQDFFFPSFPRALATAEVAWTPQAKRAGKVDDLRLRIADVAPQLTLAGADFYAKDGLVHEPLVAAADIDLENGTAPVGAAIAYGYLPETPSKDASASITWDTGEKADLTVKQDREYRPSNPNNNNNRAQNGIFELVLDTAIPEDAKSATIEFTARGKTATDTLTVARAAAPDPEPEPEPVKKHVVTLDLNGGTGPNEKIEVVHGNKLPVIETPTKKGHVFDCWVDISTGLPWDMDAPVTSDLNLAARWKATGDAEEVPQTPQRPSTGANGSRPQADGLPQTGDPTGIVGALGALAGSLAMATGIFTRKMRK